MSNQFVETSNLSWVGRIKESFKAMLFGLLMFVGSFPLLWWNEGRSIERLKTLDAAQRQVVSVSNQRINPANNLKLVHVSGLATTNQALSDTQFGVQVNAIRLIRHVEMYQWDEIKNTRKKTNIGGSQTKTTTTSYQKKWSDKLIDSSDFKQPGGHNNPNQMLFYSQEFSASKVTVGAFSLSSLLIEKIKRSTDLKLDGKQVAAINSLFQKEPKADSNSDSTTPLKQIGSPLHFKSNGAYLYTGSFSSPQVGDVRIRFSVIKPLTVSVMGMQQGKSIETFYSKNGQIALLEYGVLNSNQMIKYAKTDNTITTWVIRLVGFALMFCGLALLLNPLEVLLSVLPLLGVISSVGIAFFSLIISFALTFLTIGLAWVYFRPVIGSVIMVLGFMALLSFFKLKKKNNVSSSENEDEDEGDVEEVEPHKGENMHKKEQEKGDGDDAFIKR